MFLTAWLCGATPLAAQSDLAVKPREALLSAMRARLNAMSYRAKVVQSSTIGITIMEVDYVAPDRYRGVGEATLDGRASGKLEAILVGKDGYSRPAGGEWKKEATNPKMMELFARRDEMLIQNLARASDDAVILVGREELDGLPMFVFQHSFGGAPGLPAHSRTKTWVGVNDGLPHKMEMESSITYDGKLFTVKTTTTYHDYNADIKIEPPM
jgi:hypothetical protein